MDRFDSLLPNRVHELLYIIIWHGPEMNVFSEIEFPSLIYIYNKQESSFFKVALEFRNLIALQSVPIFLEDTSFPS